MNRKYFIVSMVLFLALSCIYGCNFGAKTWLTESNRIDSTINDTNIESTITQLPSTETQPEDSPPGRTTFLGVMVLLVCLLLLIASVRLFYERIGLLHPLNIFLGIWFISFFLYILDKKFNIFSFEFTPYAAVMFITSFITFFIGASAAMWFLRREKPAKNISTIENQSVFLYQVSKWLLAFYLFAIVFKYIILLSKYGIPLPNLGTIRSDLRNGAFVYPVFLYFFTLPAYLAALNLGILLATKKSIRIIILVVIMFLLVILNDCTVAMRGGICNFYLLFICSYLVTQIASGRKIKLKQIASLSLTVIGIIVVLGFMLYLRGDKSINVFSSIIVDGYMYLIGPIPACAYFFEHPWPSSMPGQWTFGGIYYLANVLLGTFGKPLFPPSGMGTYYAKIMAGPFNSAGHLTYYHSDFGAMGIVVLTFLLACVSMYFFLKALYRKNILNVQISALLFSTVIFSVRGIYTNGVFFWTTSSLIIGQHFFLNRKKAPPVLCLAKEIRMPNFKKVSKWLIILGVLSLIYGGRVFIGEEEKFQQTCLTAPYTSKDEWHHVAFTVDSDNEVMRLYIDGAEVGSKFFKGPIRKSLAPLHIGGVGGSRFFKGLIDNVKIFSRSLSPDEVKALYNEDAGSDDSSLIGYWKMDDNTNELAVNDSSPHKNNGRASRATNLTAAEGKIGGALNFDGISDRIYCGNSKSLDTPYGLTVGAWINSPLTSPEGWFVFKHSDDSLGWVFFIDNHMQLVVEVYSSKISSGGLACFKRFVPLRGELIFFFAIVAGLFYFLEINSLHDLKYLERGILLALTALLSSIGIASAISLFRYNLWFDRLGIVLIIKLVLNISIFILIYTWLSRDGKFFRRICLALWVPSIILIPFLFIPKSAANFAVIMQKIPFLRTNQGSPMMFTSVNRFSGFTLNPIHMGWINVIALSFVFVLFLCSFHKKKYLKAVIYLLLSVGICAMNIWSLSMCIVLATIVVLFASNVIVSLYFKKSISKIFLYNVIIVLLFVCTFVALPNDMTQRFIGKATNPQLSSSRGPIWEYYLRLLPKNPLGLGINYEQKFLASQGSNYANTHSGLLESWAYGGFGALLAIFYLIWKAFRNIKEQIRGPNDPLFPFLLGTAIALLGLLIVCIFVGLLFVIQFWILLALALGCSNIRKNSEDTENRELY